MTEYIRKESIASLREILSRARRCAVVSHTHPDGDALGSSAALALYLKGLGKEVTVVLPDSVPEPLRFILPESIPYLFGNRQKEAAGQCLREVDTLILADANGFSRAEGLEDALHASKACKVLMDHHLNPDNGSFDLVFSTPEISSASELVFWILLALEEGRKLPVDIGAALLTGMTTDTNNFANSVFPSTLEMAAQLLATGVNRDAILSNLYQQYRENRVRLMGYMQAEQMRILPCGAAYMVLSRDIQRRFELLDGESEGLVNVPLSIGRVRLSVLLKEDEGHFRVSVRSKAGTSAQQLAARHFHGGGHENAAGGKLFIGADIPSPEAAPAFLEQILNAFLV